MSRRTTIATPCIDIIDLKRRGQLEFQSKFPLVWTNNHGDYTAAAWIEVWRDFMNVYCPVPDCVVEGKPPDNAKHVMVQLTTTKTRLGEVTWALCACGKRCRKLYLVGGSPRCQKCHNVANYASTQSPQQRVIDKAQALYDRVAQGKTDGSEAFERAPFPDRPPRMRQATYDKLRVKYRALVGG